jgi:potassium-transporting ATPase KdpC subunit
MNMIREVSRAIRSTLVLWILVAVIYPVLMLAIGQVFFPYQANGSLLKNDRGEIVGSALIGQPFVADRYFWSRPSTTNYSTADPQNDTANILKTGISGASNLAASNPDLIQRVKADIDRLKQAGIRPTGDRIYTSGSSLDPHITLEAANAQIDRIAQTRNINPNQVESLIQTSIDRRFLGIFGEPGVNVLKLNLALDALT